MNTCGGVLNALHNVLAVLIPPLSDPVRHHNQRLLIPAGELEDQESFCFRLFGHYLSEQARAYSRLLCVVLRDLAAQ
jgi:hypothetical protein